MEAAGTCAICRNRLTLPFPSLNDIHFLGEVAHIVAEKTDGPRGTSMLSPSERNQESNLLLLCIAHHKMVDDDPATYPVEELRKIKKHHLNWVRMALKFERPWRTKLHNLHYINVPRLNMLAATAGVSLDLRDYQEVEVLHYLRLKLGPLMGAFKALMEEVQLRAMPIESMLDLVDPRGIIVNFDRDFRTKNIKMPRSLEGYRQAVKGNLDTDPHIYTKFGVVRVVAKIDPRWITTTTAFSEFRPYSGKNKFAGLAVVQSGNALAQEVVMSPLVIGLPSNPFLNALYGRG